jgi:hypothetical protein
MTSAAAQRVAQTALMTSFAWQVTNGHLSRVGLLALRARLSVPGEFVEGNDLLAVRLLVNDALGVDSADELVPDGRRW